MRLTDEQITNAVESLSYDDKERILKNIVWMTNSEEASDITIEQIRKSVYEELFPDENNDTEDID